MEIWKRAFRNWSVSSGQFAICVLIMWFYPALVKQFWDALWSCVWDSVCLRFLAKTMNFCNATRNHSNDRRNLKIESLASCTSRQAAVPVIYLLKSRWLQYSKWAMGSRLLKWSASGPQCCLVCGPFLSLWSFALGFYCGCPSAAGWTEREQKKIAWGCRKPRWPPTVDML